MSTLPNSWRLANVLVVGFCILSTTNSLAATTVELKQCGGIKDRDQRLDCYDCLANGTCQRHEKIAPDPVAKEKESKVADECCGAPTHKLPEWGINTRAVIEKNTETSYITARQGLRFGADKTPSNIMYEGQIFLNLPWWDNKDSKSSDTKYWLDVPIRIGLRQLTDNSAPVKTPSYNPGVRLYWADGNTAQQYYSIGIHHYSNGQDGVSTNPDGSVNTNNGSFNTNYVEIAAHVNPDMKWLDTARFSARQHFYGSWEPSQQDQYEKHRLSMELRSVVFDCYWRSQLRMTESLGWGYRYIVKNDINPNMNIEARARDRFHTTLEYVVKPPSWTNLALYLRYDYGYDYYNINYQHRVNRLQLGFVSANFK